MKKKPNLRVVLMADDAVVKEYADSELWRKIFNSRTRTKQHLGDAERVPSMKTGARLDRLASLAIIAPNERDFIEEALRIVSDVFAVPVDVMRGPARTHRITTSRAIVMFLLRKHTAMTLPAIGRVFDRHHSTVLAAIADIETRRQGDETIARVLEGIAAALEQHVIQ
jgi:hypothetical protein